MIKCLSFITFATLLCCHAQEKTDDNTLVKRLLAEDLGARTFLFSQVVESSSGKKVLPFNKENPSHAVVLTQIKVAIEKAILTLNKADSPIKKLRRINEASRYFEDILLIELDKHPELTCAIPLNRKGKAQRSGYPDMRIEHTASKTVFYLDPKLYEKKSRSSSFRTFYFEPKTRTLKILDDAVHLLLGISHDGVDGDWSFTNWDLVDLSTFKVRLKAEFQASNKDLYRKENLIESSTEK
jgi:hypothetical protein|tara:strand:+ start:5524 stop:6243 length:720 start_codon:yes stop_codon:yes gene_type:complete